MSDWSPEELDLKQRLEKGETIVLNSRKSGPHARLVEWCEAEGLAVYIGRENIRARPRRKRSPWASPFKPGAHGGRDEVLRRYRAYLEGREEAPEGWKTPRPDLERLGELQGRALLCWCKPDACHGDVLQELAEKAGR